jgi:hypothetical protein
VTIGAANPHGLQASPLFSLRRRSIADQRRSKDCQRYVKGDHFYTPPILDLLSD